MSVSFATVVMEVVAAFPLLLIWEFSTESSEIDVALVPVIKNSLLTELSTFTCFSSKRACVSVM